MNRLFAISRYRQVTLGKLTKFDLDDIAMMKTAAPMSSANKELEIPGVLHPVLAMLAFLPMMAILLIGLALLEELPPVPLMVLLLIVAVCCVFLSWNALNNMLGGKVTFDEDALTLHRFLSKEVFPWSLVDACKVMPATGTFGDDALLEIDDRVGVGLFLRGSNRQREHDLDADVIICSGEKGNIQPLINLASKIEASIKRAKAPVKRGAPQAGARRPMPKRQPGAAPAGAQNPKAGAAPRPGAPRPNAARANAPRPNAPRNGAQRKPAKKADPVAQFRNRQS